VSKRDGKFLYYFFSIPLSFYVAVGVNLRENAPNYAPILYGASLIIVVLFSTGFVEPDFFVFFMRTAKSRKATVTKTTLVGITTAMISVPAVRSILTIAPDSSFTKDGLTITMDIKMDSSLGSR
jgi:cytochrome c biogenesis protein CcdA